MFLGDNMFKMNRKGFMMAEVVVVSSIVLVALTALYASYNRLYSMYESRIDYYDASTLYKLAYYRDYMIADEKIADAMLGAKIRGVELIYTYSYSLDASNISSYVYGIDSTSKDQVVIIYNNKKKVKANVLNGKLGVEMNKTFSEYMNYLSTSAVLTDTNYIMVMENCASQNDCKYAYLKLYDGFE